nr:recombinase family protein [Nonomuraea basaltis]
MWDGSGFTVNKFDRFARNMAEANEILTGLSGHGVLFGLGAPVYDWNDPFGRLFLQTLAMVAECESEVSLADLATEYSVGRSTIHRIIHGPETPRRTQDHRPQAITHRRWASLFAQNHSHRQRLFLGSSTRYRAAVCTSCTSPSGRRTDGRLG